MPIDRKSAAKARAAASKYAYERSEAMSLSVLGSSGVTRNQRAVYYLEDAYMRGYKRAKREAKNADR